MSRKAKKIKAAGRRAKAAKEEDLRAILNRRRCESGGQPPPPSTTSPARRTIKTAGKKNKKARMAIAVVQPVDRDFRRVVERPSPQRSSPPPPKSDSRRSRSGSRTGGRPESDERRRRRREQRRETASIQPKRRGDSSREIQRRQERIDSPRKRRRRSRSPASSRRRKEQRTSSSSFTKLNSSRDSRLSLDEMVVLDAVGDSDGGDSNSSSAARARRSRSRSSSLSLSLSPSPERMTLSRPTSPRTSVPTNRSVRSRSRSPLRRPNSEKRQLPECRKRSPPNPQRRRHSYESEWQRSGNDRYYRQHPRRREEEDSWDIKVAKFMQVLDGKASAETKSSASFPLSAPLPLDPPPPGVEPNEDELVAEDLKATPLIRYIGKRLGSKGVSSQTKLRLEGVFQFNLLSLLTRSEWVAAKSMQLLEEAGYSENKMYLIATTRGGPSLETELKSAVFTGKVELGSKPELVAQVLRVIESIVKYFTSQEGDKSSEEDNAGEDKPEEANTASSNPVRAGVGGLLKQLVVDADEARQREVKVPEQPPLNPWTYMWDHIQAESLRSLADMKNFIAKDMLRLGNEKLCAQSGAFDVAQDMVSCLVLAGYSHGSLQHLVMQTPVNDILPPKNATLVDRNGVETPSSVRKKYLYDTILERLMRQRSQLPKLSVEQLEYLVRKGLLYVMRGCDRMPAPVRNSAGANIVFNYLPPGLRELENKAKGKVASTADERRATIEDGDTPRQTENIAPEDKESTDPLNAILCPQEIDVAKPNELPNRKYLLGCIHTEWVVLKGKPQIYEISVYMSDMSSLVVYSMPDALQKQPDTMENLGFVANPDRHEFYFVQVGVGCVKALPLEKAMEKVCQFLEEKRHSITSENKNNGLVLNFYSEEELSIVLRLIESTGNKNLLLEIVKGFGCLEHFVERNKSKKLTFSGPKLSIGGEDCFYHTEVRKGLQVANLVSKTKGEALYQALEFFLDAAPDFRNYVSSNCFPSFSPRTEDVKKRLRQVEEMYCLEVFMAAELKNQRINLFLEGVFQPQLGKDLRDKPTIVASRICRLLVEAGFDKGTLSKCFKKDPEFTVNSSVVLDKMSIAQRLKVTDQTMRCIRIIHHYFCGPKTEEEQE